MTRTLANLVDELGTLKAVIARLTVQEEALKAKIIATNVAEADGNIFRVTVSRGERRSLDMDAVRAKLSTQFIAAHTNSTPTVTVRVVARIQAKAA